MKQIRNTVTKAEIATMPKVLFEGRIFVIYTEADADKAVEYLKTQQIVGVDTETRPSFKRGMTHKVALLQIATADTCFLFRLNRIGMPESLQDFLMSDVLKIGLSLKDDFMMLRRRKDVHAEEGNWIELQDYVPRFGIEDRSLQKLYANLFGKKMVVLVSSQNGTPIGLFQGNDCYTEIPGDLPKTTLIHIDGALVYVHRANIDIIPAEFFKQK